LIKTARWSLLLLGVYYGRKRWYQLKEVEDERRAYEAKMKPIWDAEIAAKKAKENREGMLYLAKECNVTVPKDF